MHYSAIFFVLVIELILPILMTKRIIQVLLVITSIIFIQFKIDSTFLIPEPWKYALEITSLLKEVKFNLRYLEMIIVFILSFYLLKDKFNVKLVTLASIQLFFYSFFSSISYLSERFNVYFDLFYALLFSAVLVKLITFVKEKYIFHKVVVTFISFFIALRYYQYIFKADYSEIPSWELSNEERFIPYQSIFKERNERKY